jgi:LPXTG-motif cell wall-anchored protein
MNPTLAAIDMGTDLLVLAGLALVAFIAWIVAKKKGWIK